MIEVCKFCLTPKIVPGPRNAKRYGYCGAKPCAIKAGLALAAEDMLTREEADHLNELLEDAALRETCGEEP